MNAYREPGRRHARGFTLLEVLIALAIVALSAGALLGSVTSSASNVIYLKQKTLAEWVALNRLTEIRIDKDMPSLGKRKGNSVMGGMRWEWEEEVTELPIQGSFRIEVRAHATGEMVDDTRPVDQSNNSQQATPTTPSGNSTRNIPWTTSVVGVVGGSRSQLRAPIAVSWTISTTGGNPNPNPNSPPGGNPNSPPANNPNPGPNPNPNTKPPPAPHD